MGKCAAGILPTVADMFEVESPELISKVNADSLNNFEYNTESIHQYQIY